MQWDSRQPLSPIQKTQLDRDAESDQFAFELAHQPCGCLRSAASSQHIIDDQHAFAACECVRVGLHSVVAILELIVDARALGGQLPWFANGYEGGPQRVGEGRAEDEAA